MGNIKRKRKVFLTTLLFGGLLFLLVGCASMQNFFGWLYGRNTEDQEQALSKTKIERYLKQVRPYEDPTHYYKKACYFQQRKKHRLAVREFTRAVMIDPTYFDAYNGMGVSYDLMGDFRNAIAAYEEALKIDPNLDHVLNNLGYSYLLQGKLERAIETFEKAVKIHPESARYRNNLGLAYAKKGLYDMALAEFRKTGDEKVANSNLAKILKKEGVSREVGDDRDQVPAPVALAKGDDHLKASESSVKDSLSDSVGDRGSNLKPEVEKDRLFVQKNIVVLPMPSQEEIDEKRGERPEVTAAIGVEPTLEPDLKEMKDFPRPVLAESPQEEVKEEREEWIKVIAIGVEPTLELDLKETKDLPQPVLAGSIQEEIIEERGETIKVIAIGVEPMPEPDLKEMEDLPRPVLAGSPQEEIKEEREETVEVIAAVGVEPMPEPDLKEMKDLPWPLFAGSLSVPDIDKVSSVPPLEKDTMIPDDSIIHEGITVEILSPACMLSVVKKVKNTLLAKGYKVECVSQDTQDQITETRLHYCIGYLQDAYIAAKAVRGYQDMDKFSVFSRPEIKVKIFFGRDLLPSNVAHFRGQGRVPKF